MEAQREEEYSVNSVEDSTTNVKSELRKRGRPRKVEAMAIKEPPNLGKKEKTRCLTEIEEADHVEESTSGGVEAYTEEPAVTSPVTKGRRRPRKGVPRRAPL